MIPRAVEQIFETSKALEDKGWSYEMEVMYVEIYMETIRDLLARSRPKEEDEAKYEIKHDAKGNTTVTGVTIGILKHFFNSEPQSQSSKPTSSVRVTSESFQEQSSCQNQYE